MTDITAAAEAATATDNGAPKRITRPTYGLGTAIQELPAEVVKPRGGPKVYHDLLIGAMASQGLWVPVADFQSVDGAKGAVKNLRKSAEDGDTHSVPAGQWKFDSRRYEATDGEGATVLRSKLYVQYVGPVGDEGGELEDPQPEDDIEPQGV